ncbi:hypothetical protein Tco_0941798 [Tanacetum coccineum]|uniref:Kinesin-like protein n=1 Tax=Tanacetum coccineum TaxID=301880 RepID=A0ABQ5DST3_9ASTR
MNTSQDIKMQLVDDNVGNQVRHNAVQNEGNEVGQNVDQNPGIQIVENMNGLSVVLEIANQYRSGNVVTASIAQEEEAGIQSTQEEFKFMTATDAHEEIERVKVNCTSEDTLQQASTSGTQSDNAPVYDSDGSAEVPKDENVHDHDIFNMLTQEVQYTNLQTELDRTKQKLETCIIKKEKEYATLWNNWYKKYKECKYDKILYDKAYNDMQTKIERFQAQLGDLKVTTNHDVCVLNYVNDMNSYADNQSANVSKSENQKKHKANVKKLKELGSKGSLASSRPSKPITCLRWIPTRRIFDMCGKLTTSSNTKNKSEKSVCDNASTSNPLKPSSKGFLNFDSLLGMLSRLRKQHTSIYPIVVL